MSRLENARHDRAVALRLRMNWCAGHDRTLNGEKRTHADPLLLSSGMADAWIVQSKHQLGSMLRDRLAYAAQLEAHKACASPASSSTRTTHPSRRLVSAPFNQA